MTAVWDEMEKAVEELVQLKDDLCQLIAEGLVEVFWDEQETMRFKAAAKARGV